MRLGDTFIPAMKNEHLWVVASDPRQAQVVIFSLTSIDLDKEDVCVLDVGDHVFIEHRTVVSYRDGRCLSTSKLQQLIDDGKVTCHVQASKALLEKIWKGAALSQFIPEQVLDMLEEQGLLPD